MKQFIVLLATILLGVTLAGFVLGYKTTATTLNTSATSALTEVLTVDD